MTRRSLPLLLVAVVLGVAGVFAAFAATRTAGPQAAVAADPPAPGYINYVSPSPLGDSAGEPSIGVNRATGSVFFQAVLETLRVRFDDTVSPATATWRDVSPLATSQETLDPILSTDERTGRTYVSQLALACSLGAFTTTPSTDAADGFNGSSFTNNPGFCGVGAAADHQTVGSGPVPPNSALPVTPGTDTIVYYCAQLTVAGNCARSLDGGLTFAPAAVAYSNLTGNCNSFHGHIKTDPNDGTAYLPLASCFPTAAAANSDDENQRIPGLAITRNGGTTWEQFKFTGFVADLESDPAVAIAKDGTVYFTASVRQVPTKTDGEEKELVWVSRDQGKTFGAPVNISGPAGVQNQEFPAAVAGDGDRAAVTFIGATKFGSDQPAADGTDQYGAPWAVYVAHTYDRGQSWTTVNVTGADPIQRGCVDLGGSGGTADCRNLLDFNGMDVDGQGRVVVAYADGCVSQSCITNINFNAKAKGERTDKGVIARQSSGRGLFAAFDGQIGQITPPPTTTTPSTTTAPPATTTAPPATTTASPPTTTTQPATTQPATTQPAGTTATPSQPGPSGSGPTPLAGGSRFLTKVIAFNRFGGTARYQQRRAGRLGLPVKVRGRVAPIRNVRVSVFRLVGQRKVLLGRSRVLSRVGSSKGIVLRVKLRTRLTPGRYLVEATARTLSGQLGRTTQQVRLR